MRKNLPGISVQNEDLASEGLDLRFWILNVGKNKALRRPFEAKVSKFLGCLRIFNYQFLMTECLKFKTFKNLDLISNLKFKISNYFKLGVILICLLITKAFLIPKIAYAQTSLSVAVTYQIIDTNVKDGDVICAKPTGYGLCSSIYDPSMYGIVSLTPALTLRNSGLPDAKPLITTGKAYVRVNSSNGAIKKGDYLTASKNAGVGMKATKSGFILGTAIDDYDNGDQSAVGNIVVSVGVRPVVLTAGAANNLIELIKQGIDAAFYSPISALRYFLAAFIVAASFILGFIYFGRIAKSGIDALGRNPLASRTIQFGIFMNVFFMIVIVAAGMGISYLILIL